MSGACSTRRVGVLIGKPEGKESLRRFGRSWEDNIEIDFRETGLDLFGSG
jgi:hypothetical protein